LDWGICSCYEENNVTARQKVYATLTESSK